MKSLINEIVRYVRILIIGGIGILPFILQMVTLNFMYLLLLIVSIPVSNRLFDREIK